MVDESLLVQNDISSKKKRNCSKSNHKILPNHPEPTSLARRNDKFVKKKKGTKWKPPPPPLFGILTSKNYFRLPCSFPLLDPSPNKRIPPLDRLLLGRVVDWWIVLVGWWNCIRGNGDCTHHLLRHVPQAAAKG